MLDETLSPSYAGAANRPLGAAAWASYRFVDLAAYSGKAQLKITWSQGSEVPQQVYAGLPDYARDRWVWKKFSAAGLVTLASFAPYCDGAGDCIVVVLSVDNGSFAVDYLLAGDNLAPVLNYSTNLANNPIFNVAPFDLQVDASATLSYGGTITSFDFDWDNDGVWDLSGDSDGIADHVYSAGNYKCSLRAHDNRGLSTSATFKVDSIDPANQAPSASFYPSPNNGDGPLEVTLDASSSSDSDGAITGYYWDYDGDGAPDEISSAPVTTHVFAQAGILPVKLTVRDNYYAEDSQTKNITLNHGWHTALIDDHADTRQPVCVCSTGDPGSERACVTYTEIDQYQLRFCRANNGQASAWGPVRQPATSPVGLIGQATMVRTVTGGVPLIAYSELNGYYPLYTVSATSPSGSSWNAPVLVDGANRTGSMARLAIVNTIPVIAGVSSNVALGRNDLLYYVAKNLDASAWNPPSIAIYMQDGVQYGAPQVGYTGSGLFHKPIVYLPVWTDDSPTGTVVIRASDVSGTNWDAPLGLPWYSEAGAFMLADGQPAFCASASLYGGLTGWLRATDADATNWPADLQPLQSTGSHCVGLMHNGFPEVYYYDISSDDIYLCQARDAAGSDWDPPYELVANLGNSGGNLGAALVDNLPVLAYKWFDFGNDVNEIRSASYY